jgi:hypothetical protein
MSIHIIWEISIIGMLNCLDLLGDEDPKYSKRPPTWSLDSFQEGMLIALTSFFIKAPIAVM